MEANLIKPNFTPVFQSPTARSKNTPIHEERFSYEKLPSSLIQFITQIKKVEKSVKIINIYRNNLTLFCEFLTENKISPSSCLNSIPNSWLDYLKENGQISNAKIKQSQKIVNSFLHFLKTGEALNQCSLPKFNSSNKPVHSITSVTHEKFLALNRALKSRAMAGDSKSIRDWALILILGECGLKVSEAANLTWGDISNDNEHLKMTTDQNTKGFLHVKSEKGERLVPYSLEVEQALELLREVRTNLKLSSSLHSKLFFGYLNISRKTRTNFLHRHGIKFIVYDVCEDILGVAYNSESLRNHAIFRWIEKGYDTKKIATLAGYTTMNSMLKFLNFSN